MGMRITSPCDLWFSFCKTKASYSWYLSGVLPWLFQTSFCHKWTVKKLPGASRTVKHGIFVITSVTAKNVIRYLFNHIRFFGFLSNCIIIKSWNWNISYIIQSIIKTQWLVWRYLIWWWLYIIEISVAARIVM